MADKINIEDLHRELLKDLTPKLKEGILSDYILSPEKFTESQRKFIKNLIETEPEINKHYKFLKEFQKREIKLPFIEKPSPLQSADIQELNLYPKAVGFGGPSECEDYLPLADAKGSIRIELYYELKTDKTFADIVVLNEKYKGNSVKIVVTTATKEFVTEKVELSEEKERVFIADELLEWEDVKSISFIQE